MREVAKSMRSTKDPAILEEIDKITEQEDRDEKKKIQKKKSSAKGGKTRKKREKWNKITKLKKKINSSVLCLTTTYIVCKKLFYSRALGILISYRILIKKRSCNFNNINSHHLRLESNII